MQYHRNAKTNIEQRRIIKESSESTRSLGSRFLVSQVTAAEWKKAENIFFVATARYDQKYCIDDKPQKVGYGQCFWQAC